jgi:membrane-bound lytic murein transglycosylase A
MGRELIRKGELKRHKVSMQSIKVWAKKNKKKLQKFLNANPSFVFFRELPQGLPGPIGALGVPITTERSVAIDRRYIPLGAPIFLSTTQPNSNKPLRQLMIAQDTGGAINGGVRADFYWGQGKKAGAKAGSMKQSGKIWVILPKEFSF